MKYLGVIVDQTLSWKAQQAHAIEKGTKWALQIKWLSGPSWGIMPKYTRRLYISVAIPRILYAADVWCITSHGERTRMSKIGPVKVIDQVATIQRVGALAIMGGLRTTATDTLNTHAHLLPSAPLVRKWCHQALTRLASLPKEHPLHKVINNRRMTKTKRHKKPLHHLIRWFKPDTISTEKIPSAVRDPSKIGKIPLKISIAESRED